MELKCSFFVEICGCVFVKIIFVYLFIFYLGYFLGLWLHFYF